MRFLLRAYDCARVTRVRAVDLPVGNEDDCGCTTCLSIITVHVVLLAEEFIELASATFEHLVIEAEKGIFERGLIVTGLE